MATTTTYRAIASWTGFSKTRGMELKGAYKVSPQKSAGLQKRKKRVPTSFYDWLQYHAILARGLAVSDRHNRETLKCFRSRNIGKAYAYCMSLDDGIMTHASLGIIWPTPKFDIASAKSVSFTTEQRMLIPSDFREVSKGPKTGSATEDKPNELIAPTREGYWFEYWESHGTRLLNDTPVAIYDIGVAQSVRSKTKQTWGQWFADQDTVRDNYQHHKQFDRKGGR
jgi:hypothetical protein